MANGILIFSDKICLKIAFPLHILLCANGCLYIRSVAYIQC